MSESAKQLDASDFMYNQAGLLVGPARQCHKADGQPKKSFASESECRAFLLEQGHTKMHPYKCDFGHWHISGKSWTRPIIQKAPREQ